MKAHQKYILRPLLCILSMLLLGSLVNRAQAQETETSPEDTLTQVLPPVVDSTLLGKSIFDILPSKDEGGRASVTLHQSNQLRNAFRTQVAKNSSRKIQGYRVRIYFDNQQNSRAVSFGYRARFIGMFPDIPAYLVYQAPFFKVTVGDFRTKSEAMELLRNIKSAFPAAFVVKENINYPDPSPKHRFSADPSPETPSSVTTDES